jgi:hypothetical protein
MRWSARTCAPATARAASKTLGDEAGVVSGVNAEPSRDHRDTTRGSRGPVRGRDRRAVPIEGRSGRVPPRRHPKHSFGDVVRRRWPVTSGWRHRARGAAPPTPKRSDGSTESAVSDSLTVGLWRCGSCASGLVHPTMTRELDRGSWQVELRCPECERQSSRPCTSRELEELDRELDRASMEIAAELGRLEAVHMEEWAARFAKAVRLDLIGADDFLPRQRANAVSFQRRSCQ